MAPKEAPLWKNSKAKQLLELDIIGGLLDGMDPDEVYAQRVEFQAFEITSFKSRLKALRELIASKRNFAVIDAANLANDRRIHPRPTHNFRGEPQWEGSNAQRILRLDMDRGKHTTMKPFDFWKTKAAYQYYDLKVFRDHIHQETRRRKFYNYLDDKNKQKMEKLWGSATAEADDDTSLEKKTIPQLKDMLRERGLKVSGRKAELIDRLKN